MAAMKKIKKKKIEAKAQDDWYIHIMSDLYGIINESAWTNHTTRWLSISKSNNAIMTRLDNIRVIKIPSSTEARTSAAMFPDSCEQTILVCFANKGFLVRVGETSGREKEREDGEGGWKWSTEERGEERRRGGKWKGGAGK